MNRFGINDTTHEIEQHTLRVGSSMKFTATVDWIYRTVSGTHHTAAIPTIRVPGQTRADGSWQLPTIGDDTVSTLDRIRRPASIVV